MSAPRDFEIAETKSKDEATKKIAKKLRFQKGQNVRMKMLIPEDILAKYDAGLTKRKRYLRS